LVFWKVYTMMHGQKNIEKKKRQKCFKTTIFICQAYSYTNHCIFCFQYSRFFISHAYVPSLLMSCTPSCRYIEPSNKSNSNRLNIPWLVQGYKIQHNPGFKQNQGVPFALHTNTDISVIEGESIKVTNCWAVTQSSLADMYKRRRGTMCFRLLLPWFHNSQAMGRVAGSRSWPKIWRSWDRASLMYSFNYN